MLLSPVRELLAEPAALLAGMGSFHCGFASHSRSKILAQDDSFRGRTEKGRTKKGGVEVDFQVNDETYFVNLADREGHWEVFVSSPAGTREIPVYEDAAEFESLVVVQEERHKRPN